MTREEAIERLKTDIYIYADFTENPNENEFWMAFDMSIKALEQEPCNDCVSRQAVIEYIEGSEAELGHSSENELVCQDIKELPLAIPQPKTGRWIPVSERYPTDTNKCYLVCYEDGCITIEYLYINDDGYPFFSEMELGVVAWMPLPEPYKQESEE